MLRIILKQSSMKDHKQRIRLKLDEVKDRCTDLQPFSNAVPAQSGLVHKLYSTSAASSTYPASKNTTIYQILTLQPVNRLFRNLASQMC